MVLCLTFVVNSLFRPVSTEAIMALTQYTSRVLYCNVSLFVQVCQNLGCDDTHSKCAVSVLFTGKDTSHSEKASHE